MEQRLPVQDLNASSPSKNTSCKVSSGVPCKKLPAERSAYVCYVQSSSYNVSTVGVPSLQRIYSYALCLIEDAMRSKTIAQLFA